MSNRWHQSVVNEGAAEIKCGSASSTESRLAKCTHKLCPKIKKEKNRDIIKLLKTELTRKLQRDNANTDPVPKFRPSMG